MRKKLVIFLTVIMIMNTLKINIYSSNVGYSWYCLREKENKRPRLPEEFSFIYDAGCVWLDNRVSDNDEKKIAYLTFDAGYENGNIEKILDVLKDRNVTAAFFILINLIQSNPDLVKRMSAEGHCVCNHTAKHRDMSKVDNINDFSSELEILNTAYRNLTGQEIEKYYRPPEGRFSKQNLEYAQELGYSTVFWSFAYADWDNANQPSCQNAKKKILDNVHNGVVILLHPTSSTNAKILGDVIDEMRILGYEFGTLDQLCG